jgi:hypothetical protein
MSQALLRKSKIIFPETKALDSGLFQNIKLNKLLRHQSCV